MDFVPTEDQVEIVNVWRNNLESEFELIRSIIPSHRYIGMDTEFPGTVVVPPGDLPRPYPNDIGLPYMLVNVNITKLIQLGLTFMNDEGFPPIFNGRYRVWQINFCDFDVDKDMQKKASIDLLRRNHIDFTRTRNEGVSAAEFGYLLMSSGMIMKDPASPSPCKWVTFQGSCDYGYLLRMLKGRQILQKEFLELMETYFPESYDVRLVGNPLWGGLKKAAIRMQVNRVGQAHQAGSDSLLTSCLFMKLKRMRNHVFGAQCDMQRFVGVLYGINHDAEILRHQVLNF